MRSVDQGKHETAIEAFYRLQARGPFSVKPDLQYINGTGGRPRAHTLIATVRVALEF